MAGRRRLAQGAAIASVLMMIAPLPAGAEPRAVLELFTSQGCSSCPPADRLLGEFAKDRSLVAVSFAIDYWDYIGWKDTLADPRFSARQKKYAKARGDRAVYTPQVVINGTLHAVGSDRSAILRAIEQSRKQSAILSARVSMDLVDGHFAISVAPGTPPPVSSATPGTKPPDHGEIWLGAIAKAISVAIERGENRGKTITYHNVVRSWRKIGVWKGDSRTLKVPLNELRSGRTDGAVAFVQAGSADRPGAMLGAAMASMR